MTAAARTEISGPSAPEVADGNGTAIPADAAGRLFGRLTVLPALLAMAWLLAGLPLLLLGWFTPVLDARGLGAAGGRRCSLARPALDSRPVAERAAAAAGPGRPARPGGRSIAVVAVAIAFGVDQLIYHSQYIIVTRDPASYIQFGNWIAGHGSLPIPQDRAAFGGTHGVLGFASFAYYQVGTSVVPQFMAGLPMVLAGGFWIGGVAAAAAMAPVLGACAVLTFGGLVARLAGPRWAPLAALVLALSLPEQFTSRSTYSEPLAQILFLGGLCLVIDSLTADGGQGPGSSPRWPGLALGLTLLVRIDGASDILPVIPYCGLLLLGRRRQALPLLGGLVGRRALRRRGRAGAVPALPGQHQGRADAAGAADRGRGRGHGAGRGGCCGAGACRRCAGSGCPMPSAGLAVLVVAGFAVRPYVQTVRARSNQFFQGIIAAYQRADHLPVQPDRLYYEISLHWVFWYIGVPAVLLGTLGAALLARRCLRGQAPAWTLPLHGVRVGHRQRPCTGRRSPPTSPGPAAGWCPPCCPASSCWRCGPSSWLIGWVRARPASTGWSTAASRPCAWRP